MDKREILKAELERRKWLEYPCTFVPYTNRDGSESWQQKAYRLLAEPDTFQILAVASNGSGKTMFCVGTMLEILYNKHPMCKLWNEPIYVHVVTESWGKQKETIQEKLAEATKYTFDARGLCSDPNIKIYRHSGAIIEIHHLKNHNRIKFSSAQEGQKGLVGIEPHLMILDEPISQTAYDELVARIRKPYARFLMCCTALASDHAWIIYRAKELLALEAAGKPVEGRYVLRSRALDNPFFPEKQIQNWKNEWGENSKQYRVRVLGELEMLEGLVMPDFDKNIVPNHYVPEYARTREFENDFVWVEAADYGTYDGTLIIWAKLWGNGECTIESEKYFAKNSSLNDWVQAYIQGRAENDVNIIYELNEFGKQQMRFYKNYPEVLRKPYASIGDGKELDKMSKESGTKLELLFARNNIHITKSPPTSVTWGLTILNSLLAEGRIKIKERCFNLIENAKKHVYKTSETTGKSTTDSPYDISMDVLRYLIQSYPFQKHIKAYVEKAELAGRAVKESELNKMLYRDKRNMNKKNYI